MITTHDDIAPKSSNAPLSGACLFISDLHLCASRPHITDAFVDFLKNTARNAKALYVLGDLFEYWAGDDDIHGTFHQQIIAAFSALTSTGVELYLMHGNRDFLIADDFCKAANATLIPDPTLIDLYGKKVLLSHGDDLCVDDVSYQEYRRQVREEAWQAKFLAQPLAARKLQIEAIRTRSAEEKSYKAAEIMDVNDEAVRALLKAHNYPDLLIHGHTHRPHQHLISMDEKQTTRWVLGDWYEQGSYLVCDDSGCRCVNLKL